MGKSDQDTFKFFVPVELAKGENEDEWRIKGIASTGDKDLQGEVVQQSGLDIGPLKNGKGLFNNDHQKGPENVLGKIDYAQNTMNGLYVEGYLFKHQPRAQAFYNIMRSLKKADKNRVQMSIEGKIVKRDDIDKSVIARARVEKVALTLDPVNTSTYAEIAKSLSVERFEVNECSDTIEEIDKACILESVGEGEVEKIQAEGASQADKIQDGEKKKKKKDSEAVELSTYDDNPTLAKSEDGELLGYTDEDSSLASPSVASQPVIGDVASSAPSPGAVRVKKSNLMTLLSVLEKARRMGAKDKAPRKKRGAGEHNAPGRDAVESHANETYKKIQKLLDEHGKIISEHGDSFHTPGHLNRFKEAVNSLHIPYQEHVSRVEYHQAQPGEDFKPKIVTRKEDRKHFIKSVIVEAISEALDKAAGEGSRGGKVIGRTKSGKPIYSSHGKGHSGYTVGYHHDWSKEDHKDAAAAHRKEAEAAEKRSKPSRTEGGAPVSGSGIAKEKAKYHEHLADFHSAVAEGKNVKATSHFNQARDQGKKVDRAIESKQKISEYRAGESWKKEQEKKKQRAKLFEKGGPGSGRKPGPGTSARAIQRQAFADRGPGRIASNRGVALKMFQEAKKKNPTKYNISEKEFLRRWDAKHSLKKAEIEKARKK